VAIVEGPGLKIVDTANGVAISPMTLMGSSYFSWKPDVNTNPPYQYAYDDGSNIKIGALFAGELRTLAGADDPSLYELMPTWSSDGRIIFARGTMVQNGQMGSSFGFQGPTDILVVDESGGPPTLVVGNNGGANYYPQVSPNGLWVAYTYSAAAQGTIAAPDAVLKLASSTGTNVILDLPNANSAPGDGASSFPTWAVDGTFISFASNRAGGAGDWDIYLATIDPATGADAAATPLPGANTAGFEHGAQWSP
jgi:Tol biopolymer transport system component